MKKPRSPKPVSAMAVAGTTVSTGTAQGDTSSSSTGDAGTGGDGATEQGAADAKTSEPNGDGGGDVPQSPPAQRHRTTVDEIAALAGIAAEDVFAWRWHCDDRLVVVTADGRKIAMDGDPEEVAR